jgi:hypothetical protein
MAPRSIDALPWLHVEFCAGSLWPISEHLRSQAARLLALAMKAYENGEVGLADALITHAMQYLDEADTLDRRRGLDVGSRNRPE